MKKNLAILWLFFSSLPAGVDAVVFSAQQYDAMGMALYDKGFYDQSLEYFQKAVQTDPYDWQAFENLGNAYLKLNHYQEAVDSFKKSLLINPHNVVLKMTLANLVNQGGLSLPSAGTSAPGTFLPGDEAPPSTASSQPLIANNASTPLSSPLPAAPVSTSSLSSTGAPAAPVTGGLESPATSAPPASPAAVPVASPAPPPAARPRLSRPIPASTNPINFAKTWVKLWPGFSYSLQGDLAASASAETNMIAANGWSGSSLADGTGIGLGLEVGLIIDRSEGIAVGGGYLKTNDYRLNQDLHNGSPSDFENETLSPYTLSAELNYYFFLPDPGGRFFISAGAAYYFATIHVTDDFSYLVSHPGSGDAAHFTGDLSSGGVGFQAGVGREFAVNSLMGVSLFVRGRYARVSNLVGTVTHSDGQTSQYGLAVFPDSEVHAVDVSLIGGSGAQYATLDFTGFDAGFAVIFYP